MKRPPSPNDRHTLRVAATCAKSPARSAGKPTSRGSWGARRNNGSDGQPSDARIHWPGEPVSATGATREVALMHADIFCRIRRLFFRIARPFLRVHSR